MKRKENNERLPHDNANGWCDGDRRVVGETEDALFVRRVLGLGQLRFVRRDEQTTTQPTNPHRQGQNDYPGLSILPSCRHFSSLTIPLQYRPFFRPKQQGYYRPLDMPPPYNPCSLPAFLYLAFPKLMGTYLCLYMCMICFFMVKKKSTKKYTSNIGQKTGTSKTEKKVIIMAIPVPRAHVNQNLNSGNRRAKGRYSLPSF